jgi:uncharacterized lipoprotein YajG
MKLKMLTLATATLILGGCATMQGAVDDACGSMVLSWLCG